MAPVKIHTINGLSLMLRGRPPKPYKLLKFFYQFCDNCKILSFTHHLKETEMLPIFKSITEIIKNFKSLYGFRGRGLNIRDI